MMYGGAKDAHLAHATVVVEARRARLVRVLRRHAQPVRLA
jgi:hypothetical protein